MGQNVTSRWHVSSDIGRVRDAVKSEVTDEARDNGDGGDNDDEADGSTRTTMAMTTCLMIPVTMMKVTLRLMVMAKVVMITLTTVMRMVKIWKMRPWC